MLGNALLSALDFTNFGIPESLERQKQQQGKWFINGFDLFEAKCLKNPRMYIVGISDLKKKVTNPNESIDGPAIHK